MGCLASTRKKWASKRKLRSIGQLAVFVPGLRMPKTVNFAHHLGHCFPESFVECLSSHRASIVLICKQEEARTSKSKRTGCLKLNDLQQALEEYLSVLLVLAKDESQKHAVPFTWTNQVDETEETTLSSAWYELLSVLHLMGMLSLSLANLLLLPKTSKDGCQPIASEGSRTAVDALLKATGYLDCAIRQIHPQIPLEVRRNLPLDLTEGVLQALCQQALGQGVEIQLGMAIHSAKATLAVKRRLSCEMVKYLHQAQDKIMSIHSRNGWGQKHQLFVKWKYAEAKAAAYYYHSLILDEGKLEQNQNMASAALQAANYFLEQSKKASKKFHSAPPRSRYPPHWDVMKHLSKMIPNKSCSLRHTQQDQILGDDPALPDFALALKPEEYQLPLVGPFMQGRRVGEPSLA